MYGNKSGFSGRIPSKLMLVIGALVLAALAGVSYHEWGKFTGANHEVVRSRQVVDSVDLLLLDLVDVETGQRGFLLMGEDRYLVPFNQSVQDIPVRAARFAGWQRSG